MKALICNETLSITVEVDATVPILIVNNVEHNFSDIREAELLEQIINAHPQILTYDSINQLILKKYGIADDDYSDPIHYIRKKKLSLCRLLSQATGIASEIIINVRKVGYKFNTGWTLPKKNITNAQTEAIQTHFIGNAVANEASEILSDLKKMLHIVEHTINLASQLDLYEAIDDEENVLLVLNTKGYEEEILNLSNQFVAVSKSIIKHLNLNPFDIQYQQIIHLLETIYSYVKMARQGSGITKETWRELFEKEIRSLYQNLISYCLLSSFATDFNL